MEFPVMNTRIRDVLLLMVLSVGAFASADMADSVPPMYTVHDAASEVMHARMTLTNGEPCNTRFGSKLEEIMGEMERNKEADEALATKLDEQFKAIMDEDSTMMLCAPDSWCDLGTCKQRVELEEVRLPQEQGGRNMGRAFQASQNVTNPGNVTEPDTTTTAATTPAATGNTTVFATTNDGHDHEHDDGGDGDDDEDGSAAVKSSFALVIVIVSCIVFIL